MLFVVCFLRFGIIVCFIRVARRLLSTPSDHRLLHSSYSSSASFTVRITVCFLRVIYRLLSWPSSSPAMRVYPSNLQLGPAASSTLARQVCARVSIPGDLLPVCVCVCFFYVAPFFPPSAARDIDFGLSAPFPLLYFLAGAGMSLSFASLVAFNLSRSELHNR